MADDDVAARGQAIFDRLRSERWDDADETPGDVPENGLTGEEAPPTAGAGEATSATAGDDTPDEVLSDADADAESPALSATTVGDSAFAADPAMGIAETEPGAVPLASDQPPAPAADLVGDPDWTDQEPAPSDVVGPDVTLEVVEAPAPAFVPPESPAVPEVSPAPQVEADVAPSPFRRPFPRVLAIANQKGGVGKTTTAVNLSAGLAELGYRVLVVDLDPQGNATTGMGVNARNLDVSIYDVVVRDVPMEDCIEPTSLRNLFVVPSTIDLAGAEIELVPAFSRELKLQRALAEVKDDFDFVVIDCPPSLGLLTINALAAATEVVVPIQCEYYALEGLGQLMRNVSLVQANLNTTLELSAIVLTRYDGRTKLAEQVAGEVRSHFGDKVCRNVVPRTVRLSEAPSFGQPIMVFDPSSRGAIAYRELAKEVSGGTPQRAG